MIQSVIDKGYRDFTGRVATARKRSVEQIDEVARGRVWSGAQAKERGLVDDFGGLQTAINDVAQARQARQARRVQRALHREAGDAVRAVLRQLRREPHRRARGCANPLRPGLARRCCRARCRRPPQDLRFLEGAIQPTRGVPVKALALLLLRPVSRAPADRRKRPACAGRFAFGDPRLRRARFRRAAPRWRRAGSSARLLGGLSALGRSPGLVDRLAGSHRATRCAPCGSGGRSFSAVRLGAGGQRQQRTAPAVHGTTASRDHRAHRPLRRRCGYATPVARPRSRASGTDGGGMDPKRWRLDGQLALVTGGSAGIGRAIARELLGFGADVLLAARDATALESARAELARGLPRSRRPAPSSPTSPTTNSAANCSTGSRTSAKACTSWSTTPAATSARRRPTTPRTSGGRSSRSTCSPRSNCRATPIRC